jgi:predicted RNA-binding protein with PUA-like domain
MAQYWILKTEPSTYSFDDLLREGSTVWDGVKNALALKHIGKMKSGDRVLIYHSGKEKAAVGEARITSTAYPDPEAGDDKLLVMDIEAVAPLDAPVDLKTIKADGSFADLALVRMPRLSVVPSTKAQWERIRKLSRAR